MLSNAGFESLIVMAMENSLSGVVITAIVQFGSSISQDIYESEWNQLSNHSHKLNDWDIADTNVTSTKSFL